MGTLLDESFETALLEEIERIESRPISCSKTLQEEPNENASVTSSPFDDPPTPNARKSRSTSSQGHADGHRWAQVVINTIEERRGCELFEWQRHGISLLLSAVDSARSDRPATNQPPPASVIEAPTGSGKSILLEVCVAFSSFLLTSNMPTLAGSCTGYSFETEKKCRFGRTFR